ncbi:ATP-binding cassette domain-containing protein [Nonomuraea sp. NPDC049152]|uniref:ATP-binding cassette domain-containing protein n=1 Tax=Nonomuraea sp. NPDC049152 TaxID=3154350 RepID=UPI0033E8F473
MTELFPGVRALDGASLRLESDSVHALLGENGAGKSTPIKILTGVQRPDEGRLLIGGEAVTLRSPTEAALAGIGAVPKPWPPLSRNKTLPADSADQHSINIGLRGGQLGQPAQVGVDLGAVPRARSHRVVQEMNRLTDAQLGMGQGLRRPHRHGRRGSQTWAGISRHTA